MRLLVVLFTILFMSVAIAEEGAKESESGVKYIEMTPKFTVNLAEPKKYLLINVQLLVEGPKTIEAVKKHMPALRHELVMLFSGRPSADLQTMEQREALRQETNTKIRETLEKMEGGKKEHDESAAEEGHGKEESKEGEEGEEGAHKEGFKEAYFTEFLVE